MSRHATIRTTLTHPEVIAATLEPDNTDEMSMRVEGDEVVTTIERETTGGLQATVDDYVVNLAVASRTAKLGTTFKETQS